MPQGQYRLSDISSAPVTSSTSDSSAGGPGYADSLNAKIADAVSFLGQLGIGVVKGAGATAANLGEMAVNAGMVPGQVPAAFNPAMRNPIFQRTDALTQASNPTQQAGKYLEAGAELALPAADAAKAGLAAGRAALASVPGGAAEIASHLPVVGGPMRMARGLSKLLDYALTSVNATDAMKATEAATDVLADAVPKASTAAPTSSALPQSWRALADTPAATSAPSAAAPRPYFLRSEADMAALKAAASQAKTPPVPVTMDTLPDAWKAYTGQELFPTTAADAKAAAADFAAQLKARGLSTTDAITAVSKNRQLSTAVKSQLLSLLKQTGVGAAQ